jgi:hypothetical protein
MTRIAVGMPSRARAERTVRNQAQLSVTDTGAGDFKMLVTSSG